MVAPTKVQDLNEVLEWMEEGKPYKWMMDQYQAKYHIETSQSMWAGIRRKYGFARRTVRDDDLIPWTIKPEHRHDHPITMLRGEARRRAGYENSELLNKNIDAWIKGMERDGVVLHYDGDTPQGWWYLPRRDGIDKDLIREPDRKTTQRKPRDEDE